MLPDLPALVSAAIYVLPVAWFVLFAWRLVTR